MKKYYVVPVKRRHRRRNLTTHEKMFIPYAIAKVIAVTIAGIILFNVVLKKQEPSPPP